MQGELEYSKEAPLWSKLRLCLSHMQGDSCFMLEIE